MIQITRYRQRPKMNGIFELPDSSRSTKSTAKKSTRPKTTKSPRPAWSQFAPTPKLSDLPKKSSREKENFSKTRTISKNGGGSKGSSPHSSPLSARMSVSQSFHIKGQRCFLREIPSYEKILIPVI